MKNTLIKDALVILDSFRQMRDNTFSFEVPIFYKLQYPEFSGRKVSKYLIPEKIPYDKSCYKFFDHMLNNYVKLYTSEGYYSLFKFLSPREDYDDLSPSDVTKMYNSLENTHHYLLAYYFTYQLVTFGFSEILDDVFYDTFKNHINPESPLKLNIIKHPSDAIIQPDVLNYSIIS